jgi:hypothetical protein
MVAQLKQSAGKRKGSNATGRGTVRAENLSRNSDQQSCTPGRPAVMITGHVPAFVFLLITRTASWLELSRRKEPGKTAEILLLRHQLTVLQRQQPAART